MATGFEKVLLASGEPRADYIQRRLKEGASVKQITAEINAPGLYSGAEGKSWPPGIVYAQQKKVEQRAAPAAKPLPAAGSDLDPATAVPAEFEDVLTPEDVAEVRAQAEANLKAKKRKEAKQALLEKATRELEHEARLAAQRGAARGDLVDVYLELAPYAPSIVLDGVTYEHGRTHRVNRKVAAVLREQEQRSWQHQDSLTGNRDENAYRRHRNASISMRTGAQSGTQGLVPV